MDLYYPANAVPGSPLPAVVLVAGYADAGFETRLGCKFKEMAMSVSWGQLIASTGLVAIAYTNREPAADLDALLLHLRDRGPSLGIDSNCIGLWACSGHVPLALSALMRQPREFLRCGALLYGYTLDLDGATHVAEASRTFRFVNPGAGKSIEELPHDVPLFIARAGQDQFPGLNDSIDRFVLKALALNRPLTLVNYPAGAHAFDLLDDSPASRSIVRQLLDFLQIQLTRAGS
jgi:acetyl esterase/lipase